ncbi:hypothetical protein, partial [Candidatus Igneacidithiobacillus taiwanensis]|uniref:hypothetical protein n=1 Tax=Candidatus Igneacidithiobacillus taiwanensis TaxID=1945924 RepID=UPI00289A0306
MDQDCSAKFQNLSNHPLMDTPAEAFSANVFWQASEVVGKVAKMMGCWKQAHRPGQQRPSCYAESVGGLAPGTVRGYCIQTNTPSSLRDKTATWHVANP